jgi:nitroreductase/NAD-dependent dihydropyrimidine dehydrogenase PreA subunit
MTQLVTIDSEKCGKDGICIVECPFFLLRANADGIPEMIPGAEAVCLKCGHCLAVCPNGAITLEGISPESCEKVPKEISISEETISRLIKTRRSIRVYKDRPVPRDLIERLMNTVHYSPTAKNLQPVHWLLVDDPKKIHQMAGLTVEWLRGLKMFSGIVDVWDKGTDVILRGAPILAVAHALESSVNPAADCAIACTTLELAACAVGIGGCWAGYFMRAANDFDPLKQFMNLPAGHRVYAALMLGYPKIKYQRIPPRQVPKVQWL